MPRKLTKRVVDALSARQKRYDIYDTDLAGFAVRVTPDGVKSFSVVYRFGSGRAAPKRRVTLGKYGAMTVEQARQFAKETLADVARGGDPAATRNSVKSAPTVATLGVDYLDDVKARRKAADGQGVRSLVGEARCTGDRPQEGCRRDGRRGGPAPSVPQNNALHGANRVLSLLGSFFAYAERQGVRAKHTNPAHEVEPYTEKARERFMTPVEVGRLGEALTRAARTGVPIPEAIRRRGHGMSAKRRAKLTGRKRGVYKPTEKPKALLPANPFAVAAIRFLLLTGWRESEALTLRWNDLDLDRGTATLPDTKTGKSQRVIGAPAKLLLSELPRDGESPYVFPGREVGKPLTEISRVWYAVRSAAKLDDVRLHDLRHSFASVSASSGGSLLLIGKLLGHKDTTTTSRYAHLLDDPIREAADTASNTLTEWLAGKGAAKAQPIRSA